MTGKLYGVLMDKLIPPTPDYPKVEPPKPELRLTCPGWPTGPCGKLAGTVWTTKWCPECDEKRRAHVAAVMEGKPDTPPAPAPVGDHPYEGGDWCGFRVIDEAGPVPKRAWDNLRPHQRTALEQIMRNRPDWMRNIPEWARGVSHNADIPPGTVVAGSMNGGVYDYAKDFQAESRLHRAGSRNAPSTRIVSIDVDKAISEMESHKRCSTRPLEIDPSRRRPEPQHGIKEFWYTPQPPKMRITGMKSRFTGDPLVDWQDLPESTLTQLIQQNLVTLDMEPVVRADDCTYCGDTRLHAFQTDCECIGGDRLKPGREEAKRRRLATAYGVGPESFIQAARQCGKTYIGNLADQMRQARSAVNANTRDCGQCGNPIPYCDCGFAHEGE